MKKLNVTIKLTEAAAFLVGESSKIYNICVDDLSELENKVYEKIPKEFVESFTYVCALDLKIGDYCKFIDVNNVESLAVVTDITSNDFTIRFENFLNDYPIYYKFTKFGIEKTHNRQKAKIVNLTPDELKIVTENSKVIEEINKCSDTLLSCAENIGFNLFKKSQLSKEDISNFRQKLIFS